MDSKVKGKVRYVIAISTDLPPGERKIVEVGGREIGVFNLAGDFYALGNVCPHKGGPLCRGRLRPHVVAPAVYEIEHEREDEILKCPWHQWEFDLQTGQSKADPRLRAKSYSVETAGDDLLVYV